MNWNVQDKMQATAYHKYHITPLQPPFPPPPPHPHPPQTHTHNTQQNMPQNMTS